MAATTSTPTPSVPVPHRTKPQRSCAQSPKNVKERGRKDHEQGIFLPEHFGTKFNTAVNGFYKSLDDTFKSFTLTAENGLDQIRAQSIGGSTAKGE